MKLVVMGGTGAFGSFYANLFKKDGFDVFISSTNSEKGKEFCKKNGYAFAEDADIKKMDFVVLSVPNPVAPKTVFEVVPKMKKGALMMDLCSVKGAVCAEMEKFSDAGIELLSVHPMHGPRLSSIEAQQVVFVPIKSGEKAKMIEAFFAKNGANIVFSTAKEHDEVLSIVHGLTHFSQFVSAGALKDLEVDIKRTLAFGSPNYNLFLSMVSRAVLQNPELYAQIQLANPNNARVREAFARNAGKLFEICKKGDADLLQKEILRSSQEFKGAELFLIESDRAVDSQKYFISVLKSNLGKKFLVENLLTRKFHYGIIKEVTSSELVLLENARISRLSLSKLRATTKEEMFEWVKKNIGCKYLDYSFLVPKEVSPLAVQKALSAVKECNFEFVGEYSSEKLPAGKKSLTFRAEFFADEDKENINKLIRGLITGLGFILR